MEMHLESTREQNVSIEHAELDVRFMPRETVHTENSYKFTDESIQSLLNDAGFDIAGTWKDDRDWYAVTLAKAASSRPRYAAYGDGHAGWKFVMPASPA